MNALGLIRLIAAGAMLATIGGCGGGGEVTTETETPTVVVKGVSIPSRLDLVELR